MIIISDWGPIYRESLGIHYFLAEPWNTWSNLVFLGIIIYFAVLIRRSPSDQKFIKFALPILSLGFIGGTIYHAFRAHKVWLMLDFMPIVVLAVSAAGYFWWKILGSRAAAGVLSLVSFLIGFFAVRKAVESLQYPAATGYSILGIAVVLPMLIYLARRDWRHGEKVLGGLILFAVAMIFRHFDLRVPLPMGSHFLWHLFGGAAVFMLMRFVFLDDLETGARKI